MVRHPRRMDLETHGADGPCASAEPDAASLALTALLEAVMEDRVRQTSLVCSWIPPAVPTRTHLGGRVGWIGSSPRTRLARGFRTEAGALDSGRRMAPATACAKVWTPGGTHATAAPTRLKQCRPIGTPAGQGTSWL